MKHADFVHCHLYFMLMFARMSASQGFQTLKVNHARAQFLLYVLVTGSQPHCCLNRFMPPLDKGSTARFSKHAADMQSLCAA